ncbi:helicase RepA family protein [Aminobacterium sp. EBM-42]|uniref:helicase RepA family protein n=1 Tax=Aminobacterium sp. EBM-42 TaxID=1918503 RepID=UPI00257D7C9B|nr:helicase RepA family protein [Aminobacterium sp. EBM-42]
MNLPDVLPVVDFSEGVFMSPRERLFVLPGLLAGKAGTLSAPGGTGKSFLLLEMAMSVASGQTLIPGLTPMVPGPVRYLSFEEDYDDIHNRLVSLFLEFVDLTTPPVETFFPSPLEGASLPLIRRGGVENSEAKAWLERQCEGMRLVILDPLSRLHEANENDNGEMKRLLWVLGEVAGRTRCAILVAHHTSKAAVLNGAGASQQSPRGASSIVDDGRCTMTLSRVPAADDLGIPEDNPLALTWVKVNGCRLPDPVLLHRTRTGILVAAEDKKGGMYR